MAKVVINVPYFIKKDQIEAMYNNLKKQWDNGLLMLPPGCKAFYFKDDDVLELNLDFWDVKKEEPTDGISSNG